MKKNSGFDLVVIGGGPAGLMAAGQAALRGARTLLLEKMDQPGLKLRITGQGRCNLTNIAGIEDFISHFGCNGIFLRQAFARFFNHDLMDFFTSIGVATIKERGGRVFPKVENAEIVAEKLIDWAKLVGVEIHINSPASQIMVENGKVKGVRLLNGESIFTPTTILATGGASYTWTGSTGDGFRIAEEIGHSIVPLRPALVPLKTSGETAKRLQALSLKNVSVSIFQNKKKMFSSFGEMMFTHFGISGPVILTVSGRVVDILKKNQKITVSIDLKPALDDGKLNARLLRELDEHGRIQVQNMFRNLLPRKLIPVFLDIVNIPKEKPCHQVTAQEREKIKSLLKDFRLNINGHLPLESAMITQGGIALDEVDPRTMQSRLIKGLYFAGEVLDLAADTGGYNLQAAFSTGWLAGNSV